MPLVDKLNRIHKQEPQNSIDKTQITAYNRITLVHPLFDLFMRKAVQESYAI
jgi:hypothetical protein